MIKTALYKNHQKYGARIVDFSGWAMPLQYSSVIKEHQAVRESTGIFDCSHMGNFIIAGADTYPFLDFLLTNRINKKKIGKAVYTLMLYENATIIDDLIVYLISEEEALLIVNAANTDKDFRWIEERIRASKMDVTIYDQSPNYSLLAIQGKKADTVIEKLFPEIPQKIKPFEFKEIIFDSKECVIARTGYTGESGVEILVPNSAAPLLFDRAVSLGALPCGLGARDSLRLEKGYPLYGSDIDDTTNPLEAGLGWTVDFSTDFVGKEALLKIKRDGLTRKLGGFSLEGRAIARKGARIYSEEGLRLGVVTSGIYSPVLKKAVGFAYFSADFKGKKIFIEIHNKKVPGFIVKKKFVK